MGVRYRFNRVPDGSVLDNRDPEYTGFVKYLGTSSRPNKIFNFDELYSSFRNVCTPETREMPPAHSKATLRMHIRTLKADKVVTEL